MQIDITIRYNGVEYVHETYFNDFDDEINKLTEEQMYEDGFTTEATIETEDGQEIEFYIEAGNPEWEDGEVIDGLAFNIYRMDSTIGSPADVEVVAYRPIYE